MKEFIMLLTLTGHNDTLPWPGYNFRKINALTLAVGLNLEEKILVHQNIYKNSSYFTDVVD
jgi:hypothetical protein